MFYFRSIMASRPLPIKDCFLSSKMACSAKPHVTRPIQYKSWSSKDLELACKAGNIGLLIRRPAEDSQIPKSTMFLGRW